MKLTFDATVDQVTKIIAAHLETLSPDARAAALKELHRIAMKCKSRRARKERRA